MTTKPAKPFLKWAGGKSQLLEQFKDFFPVELFKNNKAEFNYYEPFLGSGAVFFWVMQNCKIKKAFVNEINEDVFSCYIAIQNDVEKLIKSLMELEKDYILSSTTERETMFYNIRSKYNNGKKNDIVNRAAMTIFLNRTCYNGLYRVNSKGFFNVPFGRYVNPTICDVANLRTTNKLLSNVTITNNDFSIIEKQLKGKSFIYFDPPYKPLSKTANFTSYSIYPFKDEDQIRLANLVKDVGNRKNVKIMLSNSDDKFIDNLYTSKDLYISKINATRRINCKAGGRGNIKEILVTNY